MIQDKKMIVTIAWNPLKFHLIESLPRAEYYHDNILAALIPLHPDVGGREFVIHADNTRVYMTGKCRAFYAENGLWLATHSSYSSRSSHLAPLDFCPSGMLNIVSMELPCHHTGSYCQPFSKY
jgi:hypothetical protein